MNIDAAYFKKLIKQGEGEQVEFKKPTSLTREIIISICAFANKSGGFVLVGVDNQGKIKGQQVSDDTLNNLANAIKLNTDPKLYPQIRKLNVEGKDCIYIYIEESPLKPHFAYGRPYTRVGPTNQPLSPGKYELLLLERQNGYGFDHQLREDADWEEIDEQAVYSFAETANAVRNLNLRLTMSIKELLHSMEFARNDTLTNAALLLFTQKPSRWFLGQYEIKCGVFPDNTSYDVMLDDHEFNNNLISNFNAAISFIYRHIKIGFRKNGLYGEAENEFPDAVIREALVNMIVHRNYRVGIKSYVEIRPDWIQFSNPGHLFRPAITIEKLYRHHVSRPGNRLIAKAFFWLGQFENWGGGTLKIIEELQKAGKKKPVFSFSEEDMFHLKLLR